MKKIDLGPTIGILANLGVIAGIVFLGIELQQNNELLATEARRSRAAHMEENYGMLASDSELASLMLKSRLGEDLTELEGYRLSRFWMRTLTNLEWAYVEMPPEELTTSIQRYREYFATHEILGKTWSENTSRFHASFVEWMDENVVTGR